MQSEFELGKIKKTALVVTTLTIVLGAVGYILYKNINKNNCNKNEE